MFEVIGIVFLLLGIVFLFIPSQRKRKVFIIPLLLGLTIVYLHTLGPLAGKRQILSGLIAIDSNAILEIHVFSYANRTHIRDLEKSDLLINEQIILNKFRVSLNKGQVSDDYNKNPLWICNIEILKKDRCIMQIKISKQGEKTLLNPLTKGPFKFYYGTIRADDVGVLLEQVVPVLKY